MKTGLKTSLLEFTKEQSITKTRKHVFTLMVVKSNQWVLTKNYTDNSGTLGLNFCV